MAIIVNGSEKSIIDRTMPELVKELGNIDNNYAAYFLELLAKIGVDLFEIDRTTINTIKKLPLSLKYIYRIKANEDLQYLNKYDFKYIVLEYREALEINMQFKDNLKGHNIVLEIDINDLDNLYMDRDNKIFDMYNIICLRINNVNKINFYGFDKLIKDVKTNFSVLVDFCASNTYYMATAISINACTEGADMITTAFNSNRYAAMEEVILALKVMKEAKVFGNLKLMNELTRTYERITKKQVYCMKPILGEDIFKYESGIHADGIAKNPRNYEPFNPEDIGAHRKLYIGKHSGKKALMVKFKELHLNYNYIDMDKFLDCIREKSIEMKRNVLDNEIIEMYNSINRVVEGDSK
ncbi:homocitrate synthase/isopropylmalate synthase family protein [Clostridium arbusti]|uniref:homocitrate synthase/isopropylmalate synthase family protein n=1 Tax=Clostridium arbusti TaxID=1137848 RepID=UPI000287FA1F|nr:homocitrate synthase [Clostridium arbusti]